MGCISGTIGERRTKRSPPSGRDSAFRQTRPSSGPSSGHTRRSGKRRDLDGDDLVNKLPLSQIGREIRYYEARIKQAIPVDPDQQPPGEVAFGAEVTVEDEDGEAKTRRIVGEDEADPAEGKVSWISPLAKALIDARAGDLVIWERPTGEVELEIISIAYPKT